MAAFLDVAGGFLIICDALFRDANNSAFQYLVVPPVAGVVIGAAVGGLIGLRRARRAPATANDVPVRPDDIE